MVALKEFSAAGTAITDEKIRCTESVTIGVTTYYRGFLANTCNSNIEGDDSATYTVYTAVEKGGSRKTVVLDGYPIDNTEVAIHRRDGYVYATEVMTVYVCYLAHEPIAYRGAGAITIAVPWLLTSGAAMTIAQLGPWPWPVKIGFVIVDCEGARPSFDTTITLSNGTETAPATIDADADTYKTELTATLKVLPGETLTISTTDGKGAFGLKIVLLDV
jgi:hypothetical protein